MGIWAALGVGGRIAVMACGGVATVGAGYAAWRAAQPDPVAPLAVASVGEGEEAAAPTATVAPAETVAPVPEGADVDGTEVEPEVASEGVEESAPEVGSDAVPEVAPEVTVDTWRVAPDGAATVAGRTAPDALVRILVDGAVVAEAKANGSGDFAALFTLAANPEASLMTLVAVLVDGSEVAAKAAIAIAPIRGPEVAVLEPEVAGAEVAVAEAAEPELAGPDLTEPEAAPEVAEAPAAVMLTEEGAVVLQEPAAEAAMEVPGEVAAISVETISYTASGAVQLGGRGQGGAFLRVYLDNQPLQTVLIPDSGQWFTTLKEVVPGVYTLRVDQLDDSGAVSSRFETPFKRESLAALAEAAAVPESPRVRDEAPGETVAAEEGAAPAVEGAVVVADAGEAEARPVQAEGPAVVVAEEEGAVEEVAEVEPAPAPEPEAAAVPEPAPEPAAVTVTVQPGHTLWAIAEGQMGEGILYVQVYEANKEAIRDPDLIYPGQVFTMPSGG